MASRQGAQNRALPHKESALFKNLLQLYETRQYKQALKTADQILKKFPEHGETISMKGLVLTNLNRKEEGVTLVKKGVLLDINSHICWHVYGIVHKADRNYDEALKCYTRALRFDKDNVNILRDCAQLQLQLRLYEGLQETRLTLLRLRPAIRLGWVGLAVAYHLSGQTQEARKVLDQYLATLKNVPEYDFEFSELLQYHTSLIEELGDYGEALRTLETNVKSGAIVDRLTANTAKARLLSKLNRTEESSEAWRGLISQNPELYESYRQYLLNKSINIDALNDESRAEALELLAAISKDIPSARAPRRLSLTIASGDEFRRLVETYLVDNLRRGIPSLFADIKSLYSDKAKRETIGQVVEAFAETQQPGDVESSEDPSTVVWTQYFLAQHYCYISPEDPTKALSIIEGIISHTPTLPELYATKGRILKRGGDSIGAAFALEEARALDLQDRFINTKSAKYLLRDDQVEEANKILGLFTKKDAPSPGADLEEMQSLFYLLEEGRSYQRQGNLGMALKRYHGLDKTFSDFEDDQFDFHSYCLRRHTLLSYEGMLLWEDRVRAHPAYVSSAVAAAKIYLKIYDDNSTKGAGDLQKKGKKKAKKSDKKPGDDKAALASTTKDDDQDGFKLLTAPDPLEQGFKLVRQLEDLCQDNIEVWLTLFDIAVRRQKYLQALLALQSIDKIQPGSAELHHRVVELKVTLKASPVSASLSMAVEEVLSQWIPPGGSLETFNTTYLQKNPGSAAAMVAYAKALHHIRKEASVSDIEENLMSLKLADLDTSLKTSTAAFEFLTSLRSSRAAEFQGIMSARFPHAVIFKTVDQKASIRAAYARKSEPDSELQGPI